MEGEELERTVRELAPRVLAYAAGATGDRSAAEDAAQDALAALVARWRRHGPPESPEAFVFTVARRRLRRALRRRGRVRPIADAGATRDGRAREVADAAPGPGERAAGRSELGAVAAALARLPAGDRELLLLVAAGGLSTVAAAELLGIGGSAAKMRLHRARRRLARELEAEAPGEKAPGERTR